MSDDVVWIDGDLLHCSFCGLDRRHVAKLIAGPGVYICSGCVGLARAWPVLPRPGRTCSFCGQGDPDQGRVVARGPAVICAQCLDLCDEIIAEEQAG